jgi:hypothetical protein
MNPNQIPQLGRALRVVAEHGQLVDHDIPPDKLHEIRSDLQRALKLLDEVAGPKPLTNCAEHPLGAVDEGAPDRCLICQTRRRRAEQQKRDAGWVRPAY